MSIELWQHDLAFGWQRVEAAQFHSFSITADGVKVTCQVHWSRAVGIIVPNAIRVETDGYLIFCGVWDEETRCYKAAPEVAR